MAEVRSSSPFTVIEDLEEGGEEAKDQAEEGDKDAGNLSRPASSFQSMCQRMEDEEQEVPRFISDPVHGSMEVPLVCQAVIHSVQFDRLRSLRQLGCSHYVFPGAKHTRMEHSLGVMHLAGEFLQHLMLKRPGCATKADRLCVMLAGLCHDLGHGPFSHLWELFVAEARPARRWTHEATSIQMLDCIIQENDLMPLFKQHGIGETDIIFIKELICGPLQRGTDNLEAADYWPFQGRGPEKFFLYEFIANKISSVDVDKWDYMMRDAAAMDVKTIFNYKRFINNSDITEVDGRMRLCIRDKEKENVNYLFLDRSRLHKNNYQHKTVKLVDRMILDAFLSADPHLDILGRDTEGGIVRLSEACDDVHNFSKLSDDFLLKSIQFSRGPELAEARQLVHRIATRNLYKLVGEVVNSSQGGGGHSRADCEEDLNMMLRQELEKGVPMNLKQGDIVVTRKRIRFGCGSENPVEKVIFFDKRNRPIAVSSSELDLTPAVTSSETLLVMCRRDQTDAIAIQEARDLFLRWQEERRAE